jgi:hypothetical protein
VPELETGFEGEELELPENVLSVAGLDSVGLDSEGFESVAGFDSLAEPEESEFPLDEDFGA